MLKLGYSYIELGNVEKGKQYLQDLIKNIQIQSQLLLQRKSSRFLSDRKSV
jgi:hypothetical protein